MKNLKLHKSCVSRVEQLKYAISALIINNCEFCYASNSAVWRLHINDQPRLVVDLSKSGIYSDNEDVKILSYVYNAPWDSFVVGCSNGDVLLIQENIAEVAYKCEYAVVDILCSPDAERFILLTEQGHITLLTECFEVLNDFNIAEVTLAENILVNVGWGKKETQFHGSEGKDKRVVKEVIGDGDDADDSINICWRSDGLLFAIGYFNRVTNLRSIKIFNKDGVLQNISEPLSGIYDIFLFEFCSEFVIFFLGVKAVLSWKTTKELISFPQHSNGIYSISFMEKNGLKHGEFAIPSIINVSRNT